MTQWNAPQDAGMMTPPTEGGYLEERPTRWPTVIGVIAIVLASLGMLCTCGSVFSPQFLKWAQEQAQKAGRSDPAMDAQIEVMSQFYAIFVGLLIIGFILAIVQLIAGITLLRRRRSARGMFMVYALVALILAILNIGLQVVMTQAISAKLHEQGETAAAAGAWASAAFGLCIGIVLGMGWPVFLIIWFSRQKIKNEVATWP